MRHLDPALRQNPLQKPVDRGLMIEQALGRPAAMKYVIRAFLDADDSGPLRQDFARRLGKRREELCLGRFEVAFQRRRLQVRAPG